jgi:hypothetical protein
VVDSTELLARFVFTRSHINWEDQSRPRLRAEAFIPHPHLELSVFRIQALATLEVRQIGEEVGRQRNKPLVGRGELTAGHVRKIGLDVQSSEPPPRHADIVGWPALLGSPKEDKGRQKLIAMQLVEGAQLLLA